MQTSTRTALSYAYTFDFSLKNIFLWQMRSVFTDVNKLWQSVGTNKTHARLSNRLYQNSQCILVITWHLPSMAYTCFIRSYRLLYFNYVGNTRNIVVILADYFLLLETNWRIQCNNRNNLFFLLRACYLYSIRPNRNVICLFPKCGAKWKKSVIKTQWMFWIIFLRSFKSSLKSIIFLYRTKNIKYLALEGWHCLYTISNP